jgi:hypothetical protein
VSLLWEQALVADPFYIAAAIHQQEPQPEKTAAVEEGKEITDVMGRTRLSSCLRR